MHSQTVSDADFAHDLEWVRADLESLRKLLELKQ